MPGIEDLDGWREHARAITGSRVEVLEVDGDADGKSLPPTQAALD